MSTWDLKAFYMQILKTKDEALAEKLAALSEVQEYKKGMFLIQPGETPRTLFFLLRGIARGVRQTGESREVTLCIQHRYGDTLMTDYDLHAPATNGMEAIARCEVVALPMAALDSLMGEYPVLQQTLLAYMASAASRHLEVQAVLGRSTAAERYKWFLKCYSEVADALPNQYIASFLNMTPVTLSRTRRAMQKGKDEGD